MATIATIVIGVISLLVKWNILPREVFWWLVAGREHSMFFFPPKSSEMRVGRWWWVILDKRGKGVRGADAR
jgi:hypothetical protein